MGIYDGKYWLMIRIARKQDLWYRSLSAYLSGRVATLIASQLQKNSIAQEAHGCLPYLTRILPQGYGKEPELEQDECKGTIGAHK